MEYLEVAQKGFVVWMNGLSIEDSILIAAIGIGLMVFAIFALLVQKYFDGRSATSTISVAQPKVAPRAQHQGTNAMPSKKKSFMGRSKSDPFLTRLDRLN